MPKIFEIFVPKQPNLSIIAAHDLQNAKLDLLNAHKEVEYWLAMRDMLQKRVNRLNLHSSDAAKINQGEG